jgi:hypothetical protein
MRADRSTSFGGNGWRDSIIYLRHIPLNGDTSFAHGRRTSSPLAPVNSTQRDARCRWLWRLVWSVLLLYRAEVNSSKRGAAWLRIKANMKMAVRWNNMPEFEAAGTGIDFLLLIWGDRRRLTWSNSGEKKSERGFPPTLEMIPPSDNDRITDLHFR